MKINFTKTHGAGNDIIVIDDRAGSFPHGDTALIRAMSDRRTGIGCEGIALIRLAEAHTATDYTMLFFNPDGTRAAFCGNAARCVALFAYEAGIGGRVQTVTSDAGVFKAEILSVNKHGTHAEVRVEMPPPKNRRASVIANGLDCYFIDTGVPHCVLFVDDAAAVAVSTLGHALRFAPEFAPDGANVNFVQMLGDGKAGIRTYERGVEAESGACGTGACAVAAAISEKLKLPLPFSFETTAGYTLTVNGDFGADGLVEKFRLSGPAEIVFRGVWHPVAM